jgi:hypothetical protein
MFLLSSDAELITYAVNNFIIAKVKFGELTLEHTGVNGIKTMISWSTDLEKFFDVASPNREFDLMAQDSKKFCRSSTERTIGENKTIQVTYDPQYKLKVIIRAQTGYIRMSYYQFVNMMETLLAVM